MRYLATSMAMGAVAIGGGAACSSLIGAQDPIEVFGPDAAAATGGSHDAGARADADSGIAAPAQFQSGSRLRATVLDGGAGAVQFTQWFDSMVGVPCDFTVARDGKQRCLPSVGWTEYFAPGACTAPVWPVQTGACAGALPKYAVVTTYASDPCAMQQTAVFALATQSGPPYPATNVMYGQLGATGSACIPAQLGSIQVVPVGPEVSPATFVAATTKLVPYGDGTLAARQLVAEDGATQVIAVTDAKTSSDCQFFGSFMPGGPYANRCLPTSLAMGNTLYDDVGCTTVADAVSVFVGACPSMQPDAALVWSFPECGPSAMVVEGIGAPTSGSNLFSGTGGGMCTPVTPDSTWPVFESTGTVPSSSFPLLTPGNAGTGRLRAPSIVDGQGHPVFPLQGAPWLDTKLGSTCNPTLLADGQRCVPTSVPYANLAYADAGCSVPLVSTPVPGSCPSPQPQTVLVPGTSCSGAPTAYVVGPRATPGMVYSLQATGCMPGAPDPGQVYWAATPGDDTVWASLSTTTQ